MTEIKRYEMEKEYSLDINVIPVEEHDGSFVRYDDHAAIVAALQEQVRVLAVLTEERREFIVNGAELGYIEIPVFNDDPGTAIYERCLLNPEFAADTALREIRAQAVEGLADILNSETIEGSSMKGVARRFAARIRAGEKS